MDCARTKEKIELEKENLLTHLVKVLAEKLKYKMESGKKSNFPLRQKKRCRTLLKKDTRFEKRTKRSFKNRRAYVLKCRETQLLYHALLN